MPEFKSRLDHIGIAVEAVPGVKKLFSILGLDVVHTEAVPEQGVTTHFIPSSALESDEPAHLELLEVSDPQGTIAKFIGKRGPGIHHLSFRVEKGQLDALCARLKAEGFRLIYEDARPGAQEMRVNFIHPATAGGMLIELMEPLTEHS